MIKEAIKKIVNKGDLTYEEAYSVMKEIMTGQTTATQNAAFLASLSTKSTRAETIDEISGCAVAMREQATPVPHPGMKGAASSLCGTADCQEALGAKIHQDPAKALEMLEKVGMCFLFAQQYHSAMKYVGPIRKELGFRTVFNILGPITNPANPDYFLLGVYDEYLVEPVAKVLDRMGVKNALVVHGQDGLDEVSASAPTTVCELKDGYYRTSVITPEELGLVRGNKEELVGGTPQENAEITRGILNGSIQGTKRNSVLLNAGLSLYVAGASGTMTDGVKRAEQLIDSGDAYRKMESYIRESVS